VSYTLCLLGLLSPADFMKYCGKIYSTISMILFACPAGWTLGNKQT
jgi:hypothetical protein